MDMSIDKSRKKRATISGDDFTVNGERRGYGFGDGCDYAVLNEHTSSGQEDTFSIKDSDMTDEEGRHQILVDWKLDDGGEIGARIVGRLASKGN